MKLVYLKILSITLAFVLFILLTPTRIVNISQNNYSSTIVSDISSAFAATFDDSLVPNVDNTFDIGQIAPNLRWRNANFAGTVTLGTGPSGGSLGIGTETPSAMLDVNEGSGNNLGLALRSNGAGWGSGLQLINTSTTGRSYGIYAGADGNLHFADVASSSDRMIISSAGNVGIGTVPTVSLDVVNSSAADQTPIVIFGDGSNSNRYQFLADRGGGAVFQFTSSGIDSIRSAGDLRFEVNGSTSPTLYISSGGYVGIGTTTPDQILTVAGTLHVISGGIEFPDGTVQTTTCVSVIPINGSSTWATAGTYTWTVPSGVTRIWADIWGAGGGGGGGGGGNGSTSQTSYGGGGGGAGGGGAFGRAFPISVSPGSTVTVTVGAGGAGSAGLSVDTTDTGSTNPPHASSGSNGGASSIAYQTATISVNGGNGGGGGQSGAYVNGTFVGSAPGGGGSGATISTSVYFASTQSGLSGGGGGAGGAGTVVVPGAGTSGASNANYTGGVHGSVQANSPYYGAGGAGGGGGVPGNPASEGGTTPTASNGGAGGNGCNNNTATLPTNGTVGNYGAGGGGGGGGGQTSAGSYTTATAGANGGNGGSGLVVVYW